MKQTGIIDRFENGYVIVEIGSKLIEIPRAAAPAQLAEGMAVTVQDGRITAVDPAATRRAADDMRRRLAHILGKTDE